MTAKIPAALAAILLAGCVATPTSTTVAPAAPASWQAPLPAIAGMTSADLGADAGAWWATFGDAELPRLVAAAQAASADLAGARARIDRARAERIYLGLALSPQLHATARASHGRADIALPVATVGSAGLQASWELDLFGANAAAARAAQARLEAAGVHWHALRVAVAAEVGSTYLALRACEAQQQLAESDARSRDETARLSGLTAKAGFTAPADAELARAAAAQSRNRSRQQAAACDGLVKALVALTARSEPELRSQLAAGRARLAQPQALVPSTLPAALLAQRPDLAEAALAVASAAGEHDAAAGRQWPQVTLAGSLAAVQTRSGDSRRSGSTWSFGPLQVSFPLFDQGALAANKRAAEAEYEATLVAYQARARQAVSEVEQAFVALHDTAARSDDARLAVAGFEASLRAVEARHRGGLASLFELEDARRNALGAQSGLIELQRERADAWITLYRALGGGWQAGAPLPNS
ncbi:efflux transporter outer membrane subunit [Pseudorhodoferax sp.]|uniref:efflux transporter outer membrane subunit n=1 Tax=Pseudorhodoferax sp. TaxID=1993553 RepID=UPI002DD61BB0|nr:efflux transporter outer membrane subunit [Pseudorhodoferax sp.]